MKKYPSDIISSAIDILYLPPLRKIIPLQAFRYALGGALNMCLNWVLYFVTYNFILDKKIIRIGIIPDLPVSVSPHIMAFLIVFPITFLTGFYMNRNVAFKRSPLGRHVQLGRYALSVAGSIVLNYLLLKLFVETIHIYPTPSQIIASLLIALYSYIVQKYYTFRGSFEK